MHELMFMLGASVLLAIAASICDWKADFCDKDNEDER